MEAQQSPSCAIRGASTGVEKMLENLPSMTAGVWSDEIEVQLEATRQIRTLLLGKRISPIDKVIKSGVVPKFVEFLRRDDYPQIQLEAAWVLTNIASGTSDHVRVVIESGAVPIFVRLLGSPREDVRELAVWALGNIAGESPKDRDFVLGQEALIPLLQQLNEHTKLSMLRIATWTLSNFCKGKPRPPFEKIRPALPALKLLIHSTDEEVLADACWALFCLSDGTNDKIQAIVDANICPRLVELLMHPSPSVVIPALRTVGNISNDIQTQIIINRISLPCLLNLFTNNNHKEIIKTEACRNLIQAVVIGPLIHMLQTAEFHIKKEAAWAISNATDGGTDEQIKYLVGQGCIRPLCDLLVCPDPRIVTVCLKGLENILKVGEAEKNIGTAGGLNVYAQLIDEAEGLVKIKNLQSHGNTEINEKAVKILETYWMEDDDHEPLPPGDAAAAAEKMLEVWSDEIELQLEATRQIRTLLSGERSPPIDKVIQSGVVPKFVEFLTRDDYPRLQFEAAWVLTNIASGTSHNVKVVIDSGAVPIFVRLLGSVCDDVREQAVWALGNVAGESPKGRDHVLGEGALIPLLQQLNEHAKLSMLRRATWTLLNICRGKPRTPFEQTKPALPVLQCLIHSTDAKVLTYVCWALSYLSHGGTNDRIQAVIEANICPRLVELLRNPYPSVLIPTLRIVGNICAGNDMQTQIFINHQSLPCLLNLIKNDHKTSVKKEACKTIAKIISGNKDQIQAVGCCSPIDEVIQSGVVPNFVEFLTRDEDAQLQSAAAWVLTNIASGTSDNVRVVIESGAIPFLVRLLGSPSDDVREQAVWALGNVAGESPKDRDFVLGQRALIPLLQQLNNEHARLSMLRIATWTLSNFCRGNPGPPIEQIRPVLPALQRLSLIHSTDEEVLADVCWTLSYLSHGGADDKIQAVIEANVCSRLVELLMHPSPSVIIPALHTVGNICKGNDKQTQIIINHQLLPNLLNLLMNNHEVSIKKEACWTISNITAGNKDQIQAVIAAEIIGPLIHLLQTAELDIQKEAAWAICNAADGGIDEQIKYLVGQGCIRSLCDLLGCLDERC